MESPSQDDLLRRAFKYQEALTAHAFGLLRDWSLAQDAVQEAFVDLVRKWQEFRPDGDLFQWVRQMVRFEAMNLRRDRGREHPTGEDELLGLVDRELTRHLDERSADRMREERQALSECMTRLGRRSLDLLLGFYRQALPCEKLARMHATSANAVRLSISRLRKQLRECVSFRLEAARRQA